MIFHSHVSLWEGRPLFQPIHQLLGFCARGRQPSNASSVSSWQLGSAMDLFCTHFLLAPPRPNGLGNHLGIMVKIPRIFLSTKIWGYMGIFRGIKWDIYNQRNPECLWKWGIPQPLNAHQLKKNMMRFIIKIWGTQFSDEPMVSHYNLWLIIGQIQLFIFPWCGSCASFCSARYLSQISLKRIAAACFKGWEHARMWLEMGTLR